MRIPSRILPAAASLLLLGAAGCITLMAAPAAKPHSTPAAKPPTPPAAPPTTASDQALQQLLTERGDAAAFDRAIAAARAAHLSEQAILEARFLYHVDAGDNAAIAALLPEFLKHKANFQLADSAIFATEDDFLAVCEFVTAIDALQRNQRDAFKQHITEAFWLSPRQAAAFAPHIERVRLAEAMANLRLDLTLTLPPLAKDAAPRSLTDLLKDKKALLIHFWSPLSSESLDSLPDFATTSKALAAANIASISILAGELDANTITNATKAANNASTTTAAPWLRDHPTSPLARTLRVQHLPTMVLVAPDGRILFNGDPVDDTLWKALANIAPGFSRPPSTHHD